MSKHSSVLQFSDADIGCVGPKGTPTEKWKLTPPRNLAFAYNVNSQQVAGKRKETFYGWHIAANGKLDL